MTERARDLTTRLEAEWADARPRLAVAGRFALRRWRMLWLSAHPIQAVIEAVIVQGVALIWAILVIPMRFDRGSYAGDLTLIIFVSGVASLLWAAFRMRQARTWPRGLLINIVAACVLALVPTVIISLLIQGVLTTLSPAAIHAALSQGGLVAFVLSRYFALWMVILWLAFFLTRVGVALLVWWNRLRRRSLVWSLTHAHLLVVVIGASALCGAIIVMNVYFAHSLEPQILPIMVFVGIFTVLAVLAVLPPSALFSYIFASRTTRRLRALAAATNTLRAGDYTVRVPVQGEDEVAQLQANFNAMAANLAAAVHDLEAERDTVAHLLNARRELVASVSHELRTPVSTLRGYLESARAHWREEDAPPASLRHDLEIMDHETRRLQTLIEDLFTLARAEVGRLDLRCVPADVGEEVRRIAEMVAPLAWQAGRVEVIAEVAPDLPLALVDGNRLNQALQNLLHNGVRHTPPGGIVALSASADERNVIVQVKDTGEGIAPDDLPHIFERFYRSDRARMQSASGSGLGLALVKELTEAMGGGVTIESELDHGSSFTLTFPRATGEASTRVTAPPAPSAKQLSTTR
jgi:signal transduction histidine kinase